MPKTMKFIAALLIAGASLGAAGPAFASTNHLAGDMGIQVGALGNGRLVSATPDIGALGDGGATSATPDIGALGDGRIDDKPDIGALGDGRLLSSPDIGALGNG